MTIGLLRHILLCRRCMCLNRCWNDSQLDEYEVFVSGVGIGKVQAEKYGTAILRMDSDCRVRYLYSGRFCGREEGYIARVCALAHS